MPVVVSRRTLLSVGFLLSTAAHAALPVCAQPVLEACVEQDSFGDAEIFSDPTYGGEVRYQWLGARGAFANAMVFNGGSLADRCSIDGTTSSCVGYTGDCITSCPPDPNAGPNDVSCWCQPTRTGIIDTVAAQASFSLSSELRVDRDIDGFSDDIRSSNVRNNTNNATFLRMYKVFPEVYRYEWEDLHTSPDGDFNDYTVGLEVRPCNQSFPFSANISGEGMNQDCYEPCRSDTDPDWCTSSQINTPDVRISLAVGVDRLDGEGDVTTGDREGDGRKIVVTVNTYNMGREIDMAVCPLITFATQDASPIFRSAFVRYSGNADPNGSWPGGCSMSPDSSGIPICNDVVDEHPPTWPIHFAREQFYSHNDCQDQRVGPGDLFTLPEANACGAGLHSQNYEIALERLDAVLPSTEALNGVAAADIIANRIWRIDALIFTDIKTQQFHCPSGVLVNYAGSHPDNVSAVFKLFDPTQRNVFLYVRD